MDPLGLQKLPPEIAAVLKPIIEQVEDREQEILNKFLDRLDGVELVAVVTLKFPRAGVKMAEPVQLEG